MSEDVSVKATINGVKETINLFWARKASVWAGLQKAMNDSGAELASAQLSLAMSQLKPKTGTLFANINYSIREKEERITLRSGATAKAPHARFFEKGVLRLGVQVRGTKHRQSRDLYGVVPSGKGGRRSKFGVQSMGLSFGKPFTRNFIIKARPFIKPAYESLRDRIEGRISAAVQQEG